MLPLSSLGLMGADSAPTEGEPSFSLNFAASNTLDPRVAFSRASNATYVDSAGNLAYAPHNLLTFSEQFDNAAWAKVRATIIANTISAPTGELTADSLIEDTTASSTHYTAQNFTASSGVVYSYSLYAKISTRTRVSIIAYNTNGVFTSSTAIFNLSTRSIVRQDAGFLSSSINDIGGGWFRVSVTITAQASATGTFGIALADSNTSATYTGDGVSGLYIWGAQLNVDGLQPYNSTTVKNLLGYTQEFENAAWTKSNSFIQTNLLTYSEQFDNAAWVKVGMTVTANAETAPNNTVTGDKLIPSVVTGLPYTQQTITVVSGANYAWSVYLKAAGYSWVFLDAFDGANHRTWFDLSTGTIGTVEAGNTATITDVGNGWYRCTIARSSGGVSTAYAVAIVSGNNDLNITGNGVSGVFAWGAQLVQGTIPGDYQPTTTTTLPVQYRAPDGSVTADKLVEDKAAAFHQVSQTYSATASSVLTLSAYAKAGERPRVRLAGLLSANWVSLPAAVFDLSTGTVVTSTGAATATITSVGNGWYRCAIYGQTVSTGTTSVGLGAGPVQAGGTTNNYTGDGTSGIYIWGAQISDSASLDPYVYNFAAAPAAAAYYGPRFDHNPSTLAPLGLLIEEQRTNSIRNSVGVGAVAPSTFPTNWQNLIVAGLTATVVGTGTQNGITYLDVRVNGTPSVSTYYNLVPDILVAGVSGQTWTGSFWLSLIAGSLTNTNANIEIREADAAQTFLANTLTLLPITSTLTRYSQVRTLNNPSTAFVSVRSVWQVTSGLPVDFTLRIGLPQLEQGAFATSVIPTTTAAATRATDTAVMQGANFSNWYNPVEGTLFVEAANAQAAPALFSTDDGTTSNRVITYFNAANSPAFRVVSGGVDQANFAAGSIAQNATFRLAAAYQLNNFAASLNGAATVTDTSGTVPTVQTTARLGANVSGATIINGYLRRIAYYPRRLSNNELQAITT